MQDRYLFRGRRLDNGGWIEGHYAVNEYGHPYILVPSELGYFCWYNIDPATVGRCADLCDKFETLIFEGDITRLVLPTGEVRHFEVCIETVTRRIVTHPSFDKPIERVSITGVVFKWRGFELFPCVDDAWISDVSRMKVIGNIHDNPELLEVDRPCEPS